MKFIYAAVGLLTLVAWKNKRDRKAAATAEYAEQLRRKYA